MEELNSRRQKARAYFGRMIGNLTAEPERATATHTTKVPTTRQFNQRHGENLFNDDPPPWNPPAIEPGDDPGVQAMLQHAAAEHEAIGELEAVGDWDGAVQRLHQLVNHLLDGMAADDARWAAEQGEIREQDRLEDEAAGA